MSSPAKQAKEASANPKAANAEHLKILGQYSACDVSDALLKLKVPGAGFLCDLRHFAPAGVTSDKLSLLPKIIAPAQTILFVPKHATQTNDPSFFQFPFPSSIPPDQPLLESNIPPNSHYVDHARPGAFVVMSQPREQQCAILGGIMASRMKKLGVKGIVVGGRVRDLGELKARHVPIWASGTSTVGAGSESRVWAIDVPVRVQGVLVYPGDIVFSDPIEGVVVIPADKLEAVVELIPKLVRADDKVKEEVEAGMSVREAFAKHRSSL